ncbi:tetratricopeptide repeat protein [Nocardiopsis exhalans]|uniref:Tetratricopeptide repeat protein n=1 Tax=Nocardiopsis exhalans TaxID=163604 RepID=A0ABY5DAE4_9ACTN|nr:tetratricopeptide repeat protein [Nocardiopsis exhalans]USY20706.1 tetratricopeptide repeat protein [Nocardiopsis exhalans]
MGHAHLPEDPDQLTALWRTTTADSRLLVVIENCTPNAALGLFPAGAECAGIATAHRGLNNLVAAGGRFVRLAALSDSTVGELIALLIDRPVPAPLLQHAVTSTGGMPLAATLTAAVLARNLHTPLAETEQESLVPDRITQILSEFPEQAASAAALVAGFPGPSVPTDMAASFLGTTTDDAHHILRELVDAALLLDLGQGRYAVHDQVRAPLMHQLTSELRTRMVDQIAEFYRVRSAAVDLVLNPWRWRADNEGAQLAREAQSRGPWFASQNQALAWMDGEIDNLIASARMLHRLGRPEVWMIVDHLGTYVVRRKPVVARELYEWGVESARATDDGRALGLMLQRLSTTLHPDWQAALDLNEEAKTVYKRAAFLQGVASAYESIGSLLGHLGRLDEAEEAQLTSLRLHEEIGNPRGAAFQLRRLGEIYARQGRREEAQKAFASSCRSLLLKLDTPDIYQATRSAQGMIGLLLDQDDSALLPVVEVLALQGLASTQVTDSHVQEASLHLELAKLARVRQERASEISHLQQAVRPLHPGHPVVDQATARLSELGELTQ